MSLSVNSVFEVQTGGSDTNGGGFVTGSTGTDFSLIATARPNGGTNGSSVLGVANGTTSFICADAQFTAAIVGNILYFAGGTGSITPVWRQVMSRTNTTTIVLDAAIAASTGMTMNIGGALASPAVACANNVDGNIIYVKYNVTPFAITSASLNVSGGCLRNLNYYSAIVGYDSTRTVNNRDTNRPTLQANGIASASIVEVVRVIANIIVDGNNLAGIAGFNPPNKVFNCKAFNCKANGFSGGDCYWCEATNCTGYGFYSLTLCCGCISHNNVGYGFGVQIAMWCKAWANTISGFYQVPNYCTCINSISYANAGNGFDSLGRQASFINCHTESNTGAGYVVDGVTTLWSCAAYSNTGGNSSGIPSPLSDVLTILSSTAFINAAGGNFALNNTIGGGASLRVASYQINNLPIGSTTISYLDIGVAQHQDSPSSIVVNVSNTMIIDPLKISSY